MEIREATIDDLNCWSEMRTELWPETEDKHLSEIQDYFEGNSIDVVQVYLAEVDGKIIGFLELNIRNFAEGSRQSKVPYVEAWYIKPTHQNKGYGKQLMRHAETWAKSLGYSELASDTEVENEKSIRLHKQLGFTETERIVCFMKHLKTP